MAKRKSETAEAAKPTKKPTKTLPSTRYSLCIPSSIISNSNAYNLEQITHIAYQIAKAATIYDVAEIVILDIPSTETRHAQQEKELNKVVELGSTDKGGKKIKFNFADDELPVNKDGKSKSTASSADDEESSKTPRDIPNENNSLLLASLLQFFVTPPYLVNAVFAHNNLKHKFKYAHKLPKLTTLPFMQNNSVQSDFKEGLTIAKASPKSKLASSTSKNKKKSAVKKLSVTKYVNIGADQPIALHHDVPVNVRVTVDVKNCSIVSPLAAYGTAGNRSSFGYFVRVAKKFSSLFTASSFPDGYTASVHVNSGDYFRDSATKNDNLPAPVDLTSVKVKGGQVLLVVSPIKDLEYSFKQDKANLEGVENVAQMFDGGLDVPLGVKIEDGALIALTKVN